MNTSIAVRSFPDPKAHVSTKPIGALLACAATALLLGCNSMAVGEAVNLDDTFANLPEIERLRHFGEINVEPALTAWGLTGADVRITIMGELVDPSHPDLAGRVINQFETITQPNQVLRGTGSRAVHDHLFAAGDGHGTHIAGTIAALADGAGIQGIAPAATLDVYDIGLYGAAHDDVGDGFMSAVLNGFATAMRDVTARGESQIVTGSFNLEAPAYFGISPNSLSFDALLDAVSFFGVDRTLKSPVFDGMTDAAKEELASDVRTHDGDQQIAILAMAPGTPEWDNMVKALAAYQASGGAYIVTESNYDFGHATSVLNALPSLDERIDPALWISAVMTEPHAFSRANSKAEVDAAMRDGPYITPLNGCGTQAQTYCISVPSYAVLSTMTERVAEEDMPVLSFDGRHFQAFSGHSMGAPMIAAALALLEEYNQNHNLGLSMRDLVRILKDNADQSFPGYDPIRNGLGMLDVEAAIAALRAL